jgi:low temperature requirement protein LtrA
MLLAILSVAALAVSIPYAFTTGATIFILSYVATRAVLIALYVRAHRHVPQARALTSRYLMGFGLGTAVWLLSIAFTGEARYVLWGLGFGIEVATPLLSASAVSRIGFHVSHIAERFGLFTIIVLGETVTMAVIAISSMPLTTAVAAVAAGGLLIAGCQWWIYFTFADQTSLQSGQGWQPYVLGHIIVYAGITIAAAGTLAAIRAAGEDTLDTGTQAALLGGTAAFLAALAAIQMITMRQVLIRSAVIWLTAAALLTTLATIATMPALAIVILTFTILMGTVVLHGQEHAFGRTPDAKPTTPGSQ